MNNTIEADFQRELALLEAECLGWIPLEPGVYLHVGDTNATRVRVVGVPEAGAAVLLRMVLRSMPVMRSISRCGLLGFKTFALWPSF